MLHHPEDGRGAVFYGCGVWVARCHAVVDADDEGVLLGREVRGPAGVVLRAADCVAATVEVDDDGEEVFGIGDWGSGGGCRGGLGRAEGIGGRSVEVEGD